MPAPTPTDIDTAVDHWFQNRIATGAIARTTDAYNQAFSALAELKASLAKLIAQPVSQPEPEEHTAEE